MRSGLLLLLLLPLCLLVAAAAPAPRERIQKSFRESDDFLINPDCGWVAYNYEDTYALRRRVAGGGEPFAFASVMYTRHPSKAWVDPEGGFEGSAPLELLEDWIRSDRHVAFRIYANGPDDLPAPLRDAPTTFTYKADGRSATGIRYWDEAYVSDHRRLVEFLGARLGDSPYLAFVDIGGVGNTGGEWFLDPREPFTRAGLDDDAHFRLVETFVAMYREAFPQARLFISYECVAKAGKRRQDVARLLARNKVGVRDDGLGGWPYPRQDPPADAWPMPTFWPDAPVLFEGSGRGGGVYGWRMQGKEPERVLDWALEKARPSYVNIGGAETNSQKACDELAELLTSYGRRLGYRFVLLEAACPAAFERGEVCELETTWANRGVAPCYVERALEVSLFDSEGRFAMAVACPPQPPTTQWAPGQELEVRARFSVPETVSEGQYVLKLAMLSGDSRAPTRRVNIATEGADAQRRHTVGTVRLK